MSEPDWSLIHTHPEQFFALEKDFNAKDLKRAYAKLIKRFKPEKHPKEFSQIRAAYEGLKDFLNLQEQLGDAQALPFVWGTNSPVQVSLSKSHPPENHFHSYEQTDEELDLFLQGKRKDLQGNPELLHELLNKLEQQQHKSLSDHLVYELCLELHPDRDVFDQITALSAALSKNSGHPYIVNKLRVLLRRSSVIDAADRVLPIVCPALSAESLVVITFPLWRHCLIHHTDQFSQLWKDCISPHELQNVDKTDQLLTRLMPTAVWVFEESQIIATLNLIESRHNFSVYSNDEELDLTIALLDLKQLMEQDLGKISIGYLKSFTSTLKEYFTGSAAKAPKTFEHLVQQFSERLESGRTPLTACHDDSLYELIEETWEFLRMYHWRYENGTTEFDGRQMSYAVLGVPCNVAYGNSIPEYQEQSENSSDMENGYRVIAIGIPLLILLFRILRMLSHE